VRAMLTALLFASASPARVLQLGLGGGSLARFLITNFPECVIDAVERRAGVVSVAHEYFGLPRNPRLRIAVAEAVEYTQSLARSESGTYDLILVDAYDHQGMDCSINAEEFFRACASLLRPSGTVSINLWGTHSASLKHSVELLTSCFPGRAYKLAVPNKGNIIGLGLGRSVDKVDPLALMPKARAIEIELGLEMPYFLRNVKSLS
ncbi:MAG: uncharacterized protein H6R26_2503, partial [Proteobacteria bacterium]|nr:uncharacterized protein [Pseudomonadota bacterium]